MFQKRSVVVTALLMGVSLPYLSLAKEKKNFDKSVFSIYQSLPANIDAVNATHQKVASQFPGWAVTSNKLNGLFSDIYGAPVSLPGGSLSDKVTNCLDLLSSLGVIENEWVKVNEANAPKASYVYYKQVISGHEVAMSRLGFRFTKGGMLARIQMKNYGEPEGTLSPTLSAADAKAAAVKDITEVSVSVTSVDADWSWFPIPKANGYTLHPAWHFTIEGTAQGSIPLKLTGYVDAIDGSVIYRSNEVKETGFDLTVKGMVYKNGTLLPPTLEPLPDLWVNQDTDTLLTDTAGLTSSLLWTLPLTPTVPLAGKWSTVVDYTTGTTPIFSDSVLLPGTTYTYPVTAPSSSRHVNAYYHVNRVHNFMKGFYPDFTGMDFSLPTNIDLTTGTCNAYYNSSTINFFAADGVCNSFAEVGDIIYHEYGHGISDHFYSNISGTTIVNGALNEANSDIWAMSITHNPVLGANSFVGFQGFIRRYDMTPQVYPIDWAPHSGFADPHENGQIIAGSWWDVGVNLGSVDSMTKLFTDVYYDVPDGPDGTEGEVFQSILVDALMADDDDANLLNGTPHYKQIVAAFAKHGLYLTGDATLKHTELTHQPAGSPITVTAKLTTTTTTYTHDLTLYYRLNGTGSWNSVTLTAGDTAYSCTIPAQAEGTTVEYYFTVHDALTTPIAYFPITCNPAMPSDEVSLPYQFGVGVHYMEYEDFQSIPAGWHVGDNTGDDATAGKFKDAVPVASPYVAFLTAYPGHDHSTGTGKCLVAGNGGIGGIGGTSVTMGTTSILSAVLDISAYTTPIVEYYRWFSNEQGNSNMKNDPWRVLIRDAGADGNPWIEVERTYQADVKWRRHIFPVRNYLPFASSIQIKYVLSDSVLANWADDGQGITVGAVDDFFLRDKGEQTGVINTVAAKAQVYPNPADDKINITLQDNSSKGTISLYDMTGNSVSSVAIEAGNNNYFISTKNIAPGVYTLYIQAEKSIQSRNIVVTHQ